MFFQNKKVIGLDIGSSSIKLAEVEVGRRDLKLKSFGLIPTPPDSILEGDISNAQALSSAIRELITVLKIKNKKVSVGLWGSSVIVKRISIPQMEHSLVSEQIRWEAEQYIPYEISEINIDFVVLNQFRSSSDVMDVLLIAAVQDTVFKYAETVSLSGLECSMIDVEGFALANCFNRCMGRMPGQPTAVVNVGAMVTNFAVILDGEVIFNRDIPVGGGAYTREISQRMSLSLSESESIKLGISTGEQVPEEALSVVESVHDSIVDEIVGTIEFFHNTTGEVTLNKVFVTGGAIRTPGLMSAMAQNFDCERFDPVGYMKVNSRALSRQFIDRIRDVSSVAIGLALREVGDS